MPVKALAWSPPLTSMIFSFFFASTFLLGAGAFFGGILLVGWNQYWYRYWMGKTLWNKMLMSWVLRRRSSRKSSVGKQQRVALLALLMRPRVLLFIFRQCGENFLWHWPTDGWPVRFWDFFLCWCFCFGDLHFIAINNITGISMSEYFHWIKKTVFLFEYYRILLASPAVL